MNRLTNRRIASMLADMLIAAPSAFAADVTSDRLLNADREPQNWLMNHRTYDAQRYSPLERINKANVKDLKLAYAVAIGGTAANESLESTPHAEDSFLSSSDNGACSTRSMAASNMAIMSGLGRAKAALVYMPELREMRHQTMLFVFGL
jgi:hypothetical protein